MTEAAAEIATGGCWVVMLRERLTVVLPPAKVGCITTEHGSTEMSTMSTPVVAASELIDVLADRGYEPQEDAPEFIRADKTFTVLDSVLGTVRVIVGDEVAVIGFSRSMVTMWSARFGNTAPLAAIVGAIDAAEADARVAFGA